jgi:multiple sugar transport system permease protein
LDGGLHGRWECSKEEAVDEKWDFNASSMIALLSCVMMLFAFLFMPWFGKLLTDNGARLFSDYIYDAASARPTPWISLIPLVIVAGTMLALWGVLDPEKAHITSPLIAGLGLVGLIYYYFAFYGPTPVYTSPKLIPGNGFWVVLTGLVLMVLQVLLAIPPVHRFLEKLTPPPRRKGGSNSKWVPYLFLAPALLLYFVWIIAPTFYTMYLSLTNWDGVSAPKYIGFANYIRLFTKDKLFIESLGNNLRWLLVFITIPTTLGLGMAMVFNQEMKGGRFYKVSFYAPLVLSLPVIGLIWAWVYNPRLGLLNNLLFLLGVVDAPGWLGDRALAIWCVIAAAVWRQVGYVMILYLAGLKNIDPSFVDAARVDGADRWNLFRHVIFPLLAPVTTIIIVISIIDSLRSFDLVSIMTRGGQSTQVLANFMYIEAFNNYRMGYGAAIAVVLFGISLVFIGFYLSRVVKDELEY